MGERGRRSNPGGSRMKQQRKRRKRQESAAPPLPPDLERDDDDGDVSDEDVRFVLSNRKFAGFLANLDPKKIDKQVMGLKDAMEVNYERRQQKIKARQREEEREGEEEEGEEEEGEEEEEDDENATDPDGSGDKRKVGNARKKRKDASAERVDALPVKSLDGKLMLRMYETDERGSSQKAGDGESDGDGERRSALTEEERRSIVRAKGTNARKRIPAAAKVASEKNKLSSEDEEEEEKEREYEDQTGNEADSPSSSSSSSSDDDDDDDGDGDDGDDEEKGRGGTKGKGKEGEIGGKKMSRKMLRRQQKELKRNELKSEREAKKLEIRMAAARREDLEAVKMIASTQERRECLRTRIAEIATAILANPEGRIALVKELLDLCGDSDLAVQQLSMLSVAAIFKDIIPGYRIRMPTEEELAVKVSKEVQKLRDYESTLLKTYERFVNVAVKRTTIHSELPLRRAAYRCLCVLLTAVPHFNLSDTLVRAVIPAMDSVDSECRSMCCRALKDVFKNEGKHNGEVSMEAVELIADFVRQQNCQLQPEVVEVFEVLSFDEDLRATEDEEGDDKNRYDKKRADKQGKKKGKKKVLTEGKIEKQKLAEELTTQVAQEFREAEAVMSREERRRIQTRILSAVFETYFRVLKSALSGGAAANAAAASRRAGRRGPPPPAPLRTEGPVVGRRLGPRPLLIASLRGLAKFSSLISVDFMGDLLVILRRLAMGVDEDDSNTKEGDIEAARGGGGGGKLGVEEQLLCCTVAMQIVKNNLNALTVDLRQIYVRFYRLLLEFPAVSRAVGSNMGEIFVRAMEALLWEGRQHDQLRAASFAKRLASTGLHLGSAETMSVLVTVQRILQRNSRCRAHLLENDACGGAVAGGPAVYFPAAADPESSGALSTCLWEMALLSKHYHPGVAALTTSVVGMVSNGPDSLTPALLMRPSEAFAAYDTDQGGFRPGIPPPKKKPTTLMRGGGGGVKAAAAPAKRRPGGRVGPLSAAAFDAAAKGVQHWMSLPVRVAMAVAEDSPLDGPRLLTDDGHEARAFEEEQQLVVGKAMRSWFREMRDFAEHEELRRELRRVVKVANIMHDRFEDRSAAHAQKTNRKKTTNGRWSAHAGRTKKGAIHPRSAVVCKL